MGVQLSGFFEPKNLDFKDLSGKKIAIDAYNAIYQFLSIIRQPTGEPLMDRNGNVTSHLSGLLYRNANLIDHGVMPLYVFDGKPPDLKKRVVMERIETRTKAERKWKEALSKGEIEEARVHAQASSRFSREMLADSKKLLEVLGIPFVQAPSEGEAQAAHMTLDGSVWAAGSQDYDSLLFGAKRLVRNITITGKRKLPRKKIYVSITPELIDSSMIGSKSLDRKGLIEISILIGTDYNPGGIEGIGPKKAFKIIKEAGSLERAVEKGMIEDFEYAEIREFFLHPPVTDDYELRWSIPDMDGVIDFLCGERDFSRERVVKALEKISQGMEKKASQHNLDTWF